MDLDDSFTEKLIQRTRARKEYINEIRTDTVSVSKKRSALVDEQQINIGSVDIPSEESPKRHCTQAPQPAYSPHDKENYHMQDERSMPTFSPFEVASKARGLAALRKNCVNGDDQDSQSNEAPTESQDTPNCAKYPINPSKEDIQQDSDVRKDSCPADDEYSEDDEDIDENDFAEHYDDISSGHKGVVRMELDFSPMEPAKKPLNVHAKFQIEKKTLPLQNAIPVPAVENPSCTDVDPAELPLSARKALFENALFGGAPKLNQDVTDHKLSVAQRAAMFEHASKFNPVPKAAANFKEPRRIAIPNFTKHHTNNATKTSPLKAVQPLPKSPAKNVQPFSAKSPVKNVQPFSTKSPAKNVQPFSAKSPVKNIQPGLAKSPVKAVISKSNSYEMKASPVKKMISSPAASTPSPTKNVGSHTRLMQQKLLENAGSNLQGKEIADKAAEERKRELSSLVNRWEKISSSSVENNSEAEQNQLTSEEPASSELDAAEEPEYDEASLSDEEPNEEVYDEMEENLRTEENECYDEESDNAESVFDSHDAEIGSLKSLESNCSNEPNMWSREDAQSASSYHTGDGISSMSYTGFSSYSDDSNYNASKSQSCTSDSSARSYDVAGAAEGTPSDMQESVNPDVPLMYTVSFYRKQKQETRLTPVRTIVRREKVLSPDSPDTDYTQVIQEQIKALQEDILRQQTVISQTSQALNLCSATAEFSGSTEQVEGERLLLIATQKRQACLNEIQRLKTCGAQGEYAGDGKGTLTITDMQLPLKREFMASQLEGKGNDTVHYFLCLIRHGAQVIVTQMISTNDKVRDGALCFTNHIKLQNLPADFSVIFEVYALQAKKEVMPHEKKYHIRREHSKIRITPKGKKSDGKILMPAISSPGGPSAVRSPSFGVVGYTRFTLQSCNKKTFTLDKVPFTSPLDGVLKVKLQLHANHKVVEKGFLTMFEDVSGFGAWHRRWCALDVHNLSYWKYPDDENKKAPIDTVDLKQCVTGEVKLVSRDVCARPHTFQLVTVRPQAKGDKTTLVSRSYNTLTTTKFLLSADTKEERILWCTKLNDALSNVRKWDPQALRPVEALQN